MTTPDHVENTGDNLRHAAEVQEQARDDEIERRRCRPSNLRPRSSARLQHVADAHRSIRPTRDPNSGPLAARANCFTRGMVLRARGQTSEVAVTSKGTQYVCASGSSRLVLWSARRCRTVKLDG